MLTHDLTTFGFRTAGATDEQIFHRNNACFCGIPPWKTPGSKRQEVEVDCTVLVRADAFADFVPLATKSALEHGRLPHTVVYVPKGTRVPQNAWRYADMVMRPNHAQLMQDLRACPLIALAAGLVEKIDLGTLYLMASQGSSPMAIPTTSIRLDSEYVDHMSACPTFERYVRRALRNKLQAVRQQLGPAVTDQLIAQGAMDKEAQRDPGKHVREFIERIQQRGAPTMGHRMPPGLSMVGLDLDALSDLFSGVSADGASPADNSKKSPWD